MLISARRPNWLAAVRQSLDDDGFAVLAEVLGPEFLSETRRRMYDVQQQLRTQLGDRLERAGELGVLRLMMLFDDFFLRFLEVPELVDIVDATVSPTAILHLQNGFILPGLGTDTPATFQNQYHRDFPRWLNGYPASVNLLFAIDAFTEENGATRVIPGSHRTAECPGDWSLEHDARTVICPAGAIVVFDSMLWHAAGINHSGVDRVAINHQFTRSFFKQQIDYVRAMAGKEAHHWSDRTRQMLGYYARVPASLDEYYRPEAERLYRKHQG